MINIGIIGPGRVAGRHATALAQISEAQLWSVCSNSLNKAQEFSTRHGAKAGGFDNIEAMLSDENLHAVIISTPDSSHAGYMVSAMKAGKSILVEKPVCTSIENCYEILSIYGKYKQTAAVGYHLRWHEGLRKIAEIIHRNGIGMIHHMRLHWAVDFIEHAKWRINSENTSWCSLSILGTHLIDFVRWALIPLCGPMSEIKSVVKNIDNTKSDGAVLTIMRFESGTTVEIFFSVLFNSPFTLEIYAEEKNIFGCDLMGDNSDRKIVVGKESLSFSKNNPYVCQLNNFIQSIHKNTSPEVSLEEGIENVKILKLISDQANN